MTLNSINDIKHCFYINLDYRIDRRASVEKELEKIGLKNVTTRFNAIKTENGRIGCSMSHLKCLKLAKENNWDHILICEDDIQFLDEALFLNHFNKFLSTHNNWDVVLLAGNNVPPYIKIDDTCVKVSHCQTTTGYLVKSHYYDKLIDNITKGIKLLLKEPENHRLYAVDMYWLSLQKTDNWVLIIPPTVVQREDYSDIERRNTNYKNLMTDLDKQHLYKNNIVSCIVMGGLGNQLFQLFNAMAYAIRHDKRIVLPYKKQNADSRGDKISYWENILSPIKNLISYSFLNAPIYKEPYFKYKEIPNVNKSFVFDGYFQSYKYFENQYKEIELALELQTQQNKIMSVYPLDYINTISMHFRIGDYASLQICHPLMPVSYYKNSLREMISNSGKEDWNILYFYEENDKNKVDKMIGEIVSDFPKLTFISIDHSLEDWQQLLAMSCCFHNIIANSTFSWWGAYFNRNVDKMVCYPSLWFGPKLNNHDTRDLCPPSWIKIETR